MPSWLPRRSAEQNRGISIRSKANSGSGGGRTGGFSFASLRGTTQPELAKRLYRLIKSENQLVSAHETAGRERVSIATQLSEWGEQTNDEAVSDISDKVGVVLSEIGEQEDAYAHALDDSRSVLKSIRNTEKSVQPSRDGKARIADEIAKLKSKEVDSPRLVVLEQELVRAEAENLVAEAQLTNVTRQKLKEAYEAEFAATIERAEKQIILARHGQRLLRLLDDAPVVPGDARPAYSYAAQARQILNDAEDDLKDWQPEQPDDGVYARGTSQTGRQGGGSDVLNGDSVGDEGSRVRGNQSPGQDGGIGARDDGTSAHDGSSGLTGADERREAATSALG
ncbi:sphingolipid long chain base-responsive protein LSP1 [Niveomyces insectorum RCEF 264]|uniref:Sphingolipid long chain base-responsive protein LSP1 n=1 Tax=Niveomyces insectorum RCEF 264 TaxID=1081102 RepID=A0A167MGN3_9HYPO|nr:sphingolipid long chain base-responsive protein LSP1 [Niveomyces insectorum RCEF 264]